MRTILTLVLATAVAGCVVYDEQLVYDTGGGDPGSRPPSGEAPDPEPAEETLWLTPAGAVQGDVLIASLYGDGSYDLTQVVDVTFYGGGDLRVLATLPRARDEFLLTLEVPATAERSDNHLLLTFADGATAFVEDAFAVVGDPAEIPPSAPGTGGGGDCL